MGCACMDRNGQAFSGGSRWRPWCTLCNILCCTKQTQSVSSWHMHTLSVDLLLSLQVHKRFRRQLLYVSATTSHHHLQHLDIYCHKDTSNEWPRYVCFCSFCARKLSQPNHAGALKLQIMKRVLTENLHLTLLTFLWQIKIPNHLTKWTKLLWTFWKPWSC